MSASAKAQQMVIITYPNDAPNRMVDGKTPYKYSREVTLTTEDAVQLYNDLKEALFS